MIVRLATALGLVCAVAATATAQTPSSTLNPGTGPAPVATYMPLPPPAQIPLAPQSSAPSATATTPPPGIATPNPSPPANLLTYTGQLLDVRNDFVYFSTGEAFPAIGALRIVNLDTGLPTTTPPQVKMYARATFDPATKKIIELGITRKRLAVTAESNVLAGAFAVSKSQKTAAEELSGGERLTGRQVAVVFEVNAPPTTALTDSLYISTDASGWNPQAIRLDRVDAYRYRALRYFASGTKFAYRVTRGSWNSVERGEDNLDPAPHQFVVREVDSLAARVTVYHWSDENPANQSAGAGPNSIPTPFNSNPFGGGPGGIAVPQLPTPRATRFP